MTARVTFTNGNVLKASDLTNSFTYLPYAMESGVTPTAITGSGSISFTSGRFTQPPIVIVTAVSGNNTATSVTIGTVTTSSAAVYIWSGTSASTSAKVLHWTAIQMTSTTAAG